MTRCRKFLRARRLRKVGSQGLKKEEPGELDDGRKKDDAAATTAAG